VDGVDLPFGCRRAAVVQRVHIAKAVNALIAMAKPLGLTMAQWVAVSHTLDDGIDLAW
jgi:hypothetical protein